MAGVTQISGQAGSLEVLVPKPVSVDITGRAAANPTFDFHGDGRFVGLAMWQLDGPSALEDRGSMIAGEFDPKIFCSGACTQPIPLVSAGGHMTSLGGYRYGLPAGRYRMYLIGDNLQHVRVTMRLPELDGEAELKPQHPWPATIEALPRHDQGLQNNFAFFGTDHPVSRNGFTVSTGVAYYPTLKTALGSVMLGCSRKGNLLGPAGYLPGCPPDPGSDSSPQVSFALQPKGPYQQWLTKAAPTSPGGERKVGDVTLPDTAGTTEGIGGSIVSADAAQSLGWAAVWLNNPDFTAQ